jgi:hypothetical protein
MCPALTRVSWRCWGGCWCCSSRGGFACAARRPEQVDDPILLGRHAEAAYACGVYCGGIGRRGADVGGEEREAAGRGICTAVLAWWASHRKPGLGGLLSGVFIPLPLPFPLLPDPMAKRGVGGSAQWRIQLKAKGPEYSFAGPGMKKGTVA